MGRLYPDCLIRVFGRHALPAFSILSAASTNSTLVLQMAESRSYLHTSGAKVGIFMYLEP